MSTFWEQFEEFQRREESGGGGIVCQAEIAMGYKVYGPDQEEGFFVSSPAEREQKAALEKAKSYATKIGVDDPSWVIRIKALKPTALQVRDGKWQPVTWKTHMYYDRPTWQEKKRPQDDFEPAVVIPSLRENEIDDLPTTVWCRIGFKPSPFHVAKGEAGKTEEDQNGNPRFPRIAYIIETFFDEDAARQAVGIDGTSSGSLPEGWKEEDWNAIQPTIASMRSQGKSNEEIAQAFGVPIANLIDVV